MKLIAASIAILATILAASLLLSTINSTLEHVISSEITIYKTSKDAKQIASVAMKFSEI